VNANPSERLEKAARRGRPVSQRTAIVLGAATVLSLLAALVLHIMGARGTGIGLWLVLLPYTIVGGIIARRQPSNPIGPILLLLPLAVVASDDAGAYAVLRYRLGHHGLPLGVAAVFLATPGAWLWLVLLLPLPIALFPDGRLSLGWRRVLRAYLVFCLVFVALQAWQDASGVTRHISVDSGGSLTNTGSSPGGNTVGVLLACFYLGLCLAWVLRLVLGYRRSTGDYRQQLKWLACGGGLAVLGLVLVTALNASSYTFLRVTGYVGLFVSLIALPLSIGIGILRYRMYEIDRLISRTLSYLIITGLLAGVFIGMVVLATDVLPFSSPVAVAASTLAAAALFNPLRLRVQHQVDRRFNRSRYDAEAVVAAFALRLREVVDLDTVRSDLLEAVGGAVQPGHASLWLRPPAQHPGA
jgi:uncharacterized membrane-anchored protein YitT (DUF2179 family)